MKSNDAEIENYRKELSKNLTHELIMLVQDEGRVYGADFAKSVMVALLRNLTGTMIMHSLLNPEKNENVEEGTVASYRKMKTDIIGAIADGFAHAMSNHSGKPVDYLCEVHPVGEPINKEVV